MTIQERRHGLISILDIEGDLTEEHCAHLQKALKRLQGDGRHWLLLNLEKVSFLGYMHLGILLFADKEAREAGGKMKMLRPHPLVRMTLQLTRVKFLLEIFRRRNHRPGNRSDCAHPENRTCQKEDSLSYNNSSLQSSRFYSIEWGPAMMDLTPLLEH